MIDQRDPIEKERIREGLGSLAWGVFWLSVTVGFCWFGTGVVLKWLRFPEELLESEAYAVVREELINVVIVLTLLFLPVFGFLGDFWRKTKNITLAELVNEARSMKFGLVAYLKIAIAILTVFGLFTLIKYVAGPT